MLGNKDGRKCGNLTKVGKKLRRIGQEILGLLQVFVSEIPKWAKELVNRLSILFGRDLVVLVIVPLLVPLLLVL